MKIAAWVKTIYGDSTIRESDILDLLGNVPAGKHVVATDHGIGEVEVNAPNVDEAEFAPLNVCPVGTIKIEEACITEAEVAERPESGCPKGWRTGERTDKINIIGKFDKFKSQGIFAKAADMGIDVLEPRDNVTTPRLDVKKTLVCVKKEEMPIEPKYVRLVTDSIIGWGGFAEFPYWDIYWGAMDDIANARYRQGAELLDKKGFAVCESDFNAREETCYLFDDCDAAKETKEVLHHFNSSLIGDEIRKALTEEYRDMYPIKRMTKKYKEEMENEISDERVNERWYNDKQSFHDDMNFNPHYLGAEYESSRDMRALGVFIVSKFEKGKDRKRIVIATEL